MCRNLRSDRGFSLIELLLVVGIIGVVGAMSVMISPVYSRYARSEGGMAQAVEVLRSAKDAAISLRRDVEVRFIGTDTIETAVIQVPSGTKTVLRTVKLGNRVQFLMQAGVGNTPDGFLPYAFGTPVSFGASATRMFTSEGTLVDASGDLLNGSLFLSVPNDTNSARAITIFGATGLVHAWRWNGQKWTE